MIFQITMLSDTFLWIKYFTICLLISQKKKKLLKKGIKVHFFLLRTQKTGIKIIVAD